MFRMKGNMNYSKAKLIQQFNSGEKIKWLFFWGHTPKKDIGASCLSQWWYAKFKKEGITYPTAEHWMMAEKARLFNDQEVCRKIIKANSPALAKKLGRQVRGFKGEVWDANKYEIVKQGNLLKFEQNPELKTFLVNTKQRVLVEASPVDRIWGIGLAKDDDRAPNPIKWKGENLLGFALMEVRDELV